MANPKFITVKGGLATASAPYYIGVPQHERSMSKKESYQFLAGKTGFRSTQVRAAFLALAKYLRNNAYKGNYSNLDGVARFAIFCKGSFETLAGPWVKGRNYLQVEAIEQNPFKSVLSGLVPTNNTEGANPRITTVLDDVTGEYDVIVGTNDFSIAGSDLAPDAEKDDEYVAIVSDMGVETKAEITFSDLQNVKAKFTTAPTPGAYTLKVYTRSGMGDEFGVKAATRKITIG